MTAKFDSFDYDSRSDMAEISDRFELLSAYIDGEITLAHKQQVQQWLKEDPSFQQLYQRLLRLNQGFQSLPAPVATKSPQQITNAVFHKMEQRRSHRLAFWGGTAIAVVAMGLISLFLPENKSFLPQVANSPTPTEKNTTPVAQNETVAPSLIIAVNRPVVPIPKAPVAPEENRDQP
jgi:anti-sigma factor RsiW